MAAVQGDAFFPLDTVVFERGENQLSVTICLSIKPQPLTAVCHVTFKMFLAPFNGKQHRNYVYGLELSSLLVFRHMGSEGLLLEALIDSHLYSSNNQNWRIERFLIKMRGCQACF